MKIGSAPLLGSKTFIIAEAGINHNGDVVLAKKLVRAAKDCGADAVKFQSFRADWLCGLDLEESKDVENITGGSKSSYEMYKALEMSEVMHQEVFSYAKEIGICCFSSIFDPRTIELLQSLNVMAYKIASGDLMYRPLIQACFKTSLPVLVSTGMASEGEVEDFYKWSKRYHDQLVLMHCVSEYPAADESLNLQVISHWKKKFKIPVGFSDHSIGIEGPLAAVSLGASVIEKHFTLDEDLDGPDQSMSMKASDFKQMVKSIRRIEVGLGSAPKKPTVNEKKATIDSRRGLKAKLDLRQGEILTWDKVMATKPQKGICLSKWENINGCVLKSDIRASEPIEFSHLDIDNP